MKGKPEVLKALQAAIASEAHLNAQYRTDWREVKFMGLKGIQGKIRKFGCDAHGWLKRVQDRVLFLGGSTAYDAAPVTEAESLTELLENELTLEMAIVTPYEQAIGTCTKALDDASRNLFEHLLKWHQKHVGWLERQLSLISGLAVGTGEARYISEKL
jgi:bacterioferritin